jgi:hypothetical protein
VNAAALGEPLGLGALEPAILEGEAAVREEARALDVLEARARAVAARGPAARLLLAVVRARIASRRLEPGLRRLHARPDLPVDSIAESVHEVLGWPGLSAVRRGALLSRVLGQVPAALEATASRVTRRPSAGLLLDLASDTARDVAGLVERDALGLLANGRLADPDGGLRRAAGTASAALARYRRALAGAPRREGGFRVGEAVLARWLREVEAVPARPATLLAEGRRALEAAGEEVRRAARRADPSATTERAVRRMEEDHPPATGLLSHARRCVRELESFCRDARLVTIPDGPACRVERAPDHVAELTVACLDTSGPLRPDAGPSCFYLATPRRGEERFVEASLLRSLNRTRLAWVAAHETFPGHQVQHLHVGRAAHPLLRVADSEVFIEGWAHYAEGLLVEKGFRDGDPWLALGVTWARAVRLARLVASLSLHAGRATPASVHRVFEEQGFMRPEEARREVVRAVSDPTVLTYALGRARVEAHRRAARRREGRRFDLRRFHDGLLARGSAPLDLRG